MLVCQRARADSPLRDAVEGCGQRSTRGRMLPRTPWSIARRALLRIGQVPDLGIGLLANLGIGQVGKAATGDRCVGAGHSVRVDTRAEVVAGAVRHK